MSNFEDCCILLRYNDAPRINLLELLLSSFRSSDVIRHQLNFHVNHLLTIQESAQLKEQDIPTTETKLIKTSSVVRRVLRVDDSTIIFCDNNEVQVWDVETLTLKKRFGFVREVTEMIMISDLIVVASKRVKKLLVYNYKLMELRNVIETKCLLSEQGNPKLVGFERYVLAALNDDTFAMYDISLPGGNLLFKIASPAETSFFCIALMPMEGNRSMIITGNYDGDLELYDMITAVQKRAEQRVAYWKSYEWAISSLHLVDHNTIVCGAWGGSIRTWEISTGTNTHLGNCNGSVECIHVINSRYIVTGSTDNRIRVWDLKESKSIRNLSGHTDKLTSICSLQDGKVLVSAAHDKSVRIWNNENTMEQDSSVA
jgi:WD40 repeat protein